MGMNRALVVACFFLLAGCENQSGLVTNGPCEAPSAVTAQSQSSAATAGATVDQLLEAMDASLGTVNSKSVNANAAQIAVFNGLGDLDPTEGASMAWFSTGVAGAGTPSSLDPSATTQHEDPFSAPMFSMCPDSDLSNMTYDCVFLTVAFTVPDGHNSVRFDFNFMSTEFPEFKNMGFNDRFVVKLSSPTHNYDNIVYDNAGNPVNIDSAFFEADSCNSLGGTGFDIGAGGTCDAGGTGLVSTIAPVEPGETATLEFSLRDSGDWAYDSAVMLDRLQTREADVEEPETSPCS